MRGQSYTRIIRQNEPAPAQLWGGDRHANCALHTVAMVRLRSDPRTRAYAARRTTEGLSSSEIKRCIKRYIARELYPLIVATQTG